MWYLMCDTVQINTSSLYHVYMLCWECTRSWCMKSPLLTVPDPHSVCVCLLSLHFAASLPNAWFVIILCSWPRAADWSDMWYVVFCVNFIIGYMWLHPTPRYILALTFPVLSAISNHICLKRQLSHIMWNLPASKYTIKSFMSITPQMDQYQVTSLTRKIHSDWSRVDPRVQGEYDPFLSWSLLSSC